MNDFTKEELKNLLGMAKSIPIDDRILILKLESMIENYYEHDWEYGVDRSREGWPFVRKCKICAKWEFMMGQSNE